MFGRFMSRAFALAVIVFVLGSAVTAQQLDTVTFNGKVTDSNGAPVVGATVTATLAETGDQRSATTDENGRYQIINLKPGTYKVAAANSGFGTKETQPIITIGAQKVQQDFKLTPADVKAETTVTVTDDDTPAVDTTRTIVGGTVTQREIEELPVDSRNPLDLVLTLGGTSEEQLSTRDLDNDRGTRSQSAPGTTPEEAGIFGLSGGAAYSNNITIDGLDNNDDRGASFRFQPSMDSVREVQVITNQFSAEYGRASGGRVNLSTRGGTNKFRGRAYYYFRDESLNANTWNNNRRGIALPPFQENDPGFTFGGPIIKNKLFFFSSYEYDDIFDTTILDAWTPVSGGNPLFPLPAPNDPSAGTVTIAAQNCPPPAGHMCPAVTVGHYLVPTDTPAKKHIFTNRIDWTANASQSFTFSHQLGRSNDLRSFSGTNRIADSIIGRVRNTDAFSVTHNWVLNAHLINQARFQWSRLDPNSAQASGATSPAVLVTFSQAGTQVFGSTTNSSDRKENRWQIQDTMSWVNGSHTWRFGGDYQNVDTLFIDRFDITGTYTFSNFSFFAGNSVSRIQQNFNTSSSLLNRYMGMFVQDDWHVRSNLTVSAGLRYERETVLSDNNNWGPRFAIAWNPFKHSSKTVIRLGGGVFYNRVLLRTVDDYTADSQTLRLDSNSFNRPPGSNPPDSAFWRPFLSSQFPNPLTLDTVIPFNATQSYTVRELARSATVFRSLSPDLVIPVSYQANAGFEREIRKGLVFETNVTFNKTAHLWRETNPNAPVLPSGTTDRNSDGRVTLTDYLLGITSGPNQFYQGAQNDTVGIHVSPSDGAAACTTNTPTCYINVNTSNSNSSTNCAPVGTVLNTPVCRAFQAVNPLRPYWLVGPNGGPGLGAVQLEQVNPIGNSRYIGAIFELRNRYRRFKNGFGGSWRFDYTLSRLMDDGIVNTSDPTTPFDFSKEWSRSLADRTHRIAFTASIDTPYWLGKLRISPLFRWGSSAPFNLSAGGIDRNLDDVSNDRPSFSGDPKDINWRVYASGFPADIVNRLSLAPIGSSGTLGRNAGHGPQLWQFNINVTREFRISERVRLRPSFEVTNPLNMNVFSFGSNFIDFDNLSFCTTGGNLTTAQQATCDGFLAPTRTMTHRRMRLGLRLDF